MTYENTKTFKNHSVIQTEDTIWDQQWPAGCISFSFESLALLHTDIPLVMPAQTLIALNQVYNAIKGVTLTTCLHLV